MEGYRTISCTITGETPLLLHNGSLADPMNEITRKLKAVSSKRKKTDADFEEMARLEFLGSLYVKEGTLILPGEVLLSAFVNSAKRNKLGKDALSAIDVDDALLIYDGEQDFEKRFENPLYRKTCGVVIARARIMRTRPIFTVWSANVIVHYNNGRLDERQVKDIISNAGPLGLCDWRPKFGRFTVEFTT